MPWSVRIQDERGKPLCDDDVVVEFEFLDDLPSGTTLLRGIDRYQDTTFNNLQLRGFLKEWETLTSRLMTEQERHSWESVREFARRCLKEPHTYLKFIGD
jgi:hypothetical protein